jgi:metal-responsive CopG/Arc/MetJ family transcriptional regulator
MVEHVLMEATPATFKLTREMLNAIDAFGRAESRNRSSAIRQLLKAGLRAKGLVTAA